LLQIKTHGGWWPYTEVGFVLNFQSTGDETMQNPKRRNRLIELDVHQPIWDRFFWVAPLVLIGTRESAGGHDLAPKHMAMPMGWQNYFGFVCTPRHHTYGNVQRDGVFTVSFPRPDQLVLTSLAASPRCGEENKPSLAVLPVFPASKVKGVLVEGCTLFLECELDRIIDGFGDNSLIVGKVVAAQVDSGAERRPDRDDQSLVHDSPLLAYLHPGRFTVIDQSNSFPFPAGMKK
jgi:flavin reductase (DIM6/NTAB) family NADH-FMN oxidoreductase RutF